MDDVSGHGNTWRSRLDRKWIEPLRICRNWPPRLGLPPVVDDWNTELGTCPVVGLRIQSLTGQKQGAQGRDVVPGKEFGVRILLLDGSKRGRCREKSVHPMLGNHPPEGAGIWGSHRLSLVQHSCGPSEQGGVHDV